MNDIDSAKYIETGAGHSMQSMARWLRFGVVASVLVFTSTLTAQSGLDPRSMGMGGVGIAVANPSTASYFNPAVLSLAAKQRFTLEFPSVGVFLADPGDFIDTMESNSDQGLISGLENSVANFNASPSNAAVDLVVGSVNQLDAAFTELHRAPLDAVVQLSANLGASGETFGWNLYTTNTFSSFLSLDYSDSQYMSRFADALAQVNFDDPTSNSAAVLDGLADYINYTSDGMGGVADVSLVPFDVDSMDSTFEGMWYEKAEIGASFSTVLDGVCIGVTPKLMEVRVVDFTYEPDTATIDDPEDGFTNYDDVNFDIGVAMEDDDGWTYGAVMRNVLEKKYQAFRQDLITGLPEPTGRYVEFTPTLHVGAARELEWGTMAVDLDLMKTRVLSGANESQFLSAGVEYDLNGWAQIRGGCRFSLIDVDRSVLSAGVGLSPFGLHVDAALIGNNQDYGGAVQLGFRF